MQLQREKRAVDTAPERWRDETRAGGLIVVAIVLACWLAMALPIGAARAEEKPIQVPLSYIVNLSNTGSPTAVGSAEVWQIDAEVRLSVQGMVPLSKGSIYGLWLVNPSAGHFLSIGSFNVSSDGTALLDVSLAGSLSPDYTMVLVTVQPDPDPHHGVPSSKYSIAGFFPGNTAIQHQVHYLPDTGQYAQHPPFETTITPDVTTPPDTPNPWLPYAPLALAMLSFAFVWRRVMRKK